MKYSVVSYFRGFCISPSKASFKVSLDFYQVNHLRNVFALLCLLILSQNVKRYVQTTWYEQRIYISSAFANAKILNWKKYVEMLPPRRKPYLKELLELQIVMTSNCFKMQRVMKDELLVITLLGMVSPSASTDVWNSSNLEMNLFINNQLLILPIFANKINTKFQ